MAAHIGAMEILFFSQTNTDNMPNSMCLCVSLNASRKHIQRPAVMFDQQLLKELKSPNLSFDPFRPRIPPLSANALNPPPLWPFPRRIAY